MKKLLALICSLVLCFSIGGFALTTTTANASDDSDVLVSELFKPSTIVLAPATVDDKVEYIDSGLQFISNNSAEVVVLKNNVTGEFVIEYMPAVVSGDYAVKNFEIEFTDVNTGESFTAVVNHDEKMNAYVKFNDVEAGIFYYKTGSFSGVTALNNKNGIYTQFDAKKIRLRFDPSNMTFYAGAAEAEENLVWNMSLSENDRHDVNTNLDTFTKYSVSFRLNGFVGDSGSVIVYSLNGTPLDNIIIDDATYPGVFADVAYDMIVGESFNIPTAYAYDLLDGELSGIKSVLYNSDGLIVAQNRSTYTPTVAGDYILSYSVKNSKGVESVKQFELKCYEQAPEYSYRLNWNLFDNYFVGEKITIPQSKLSGGLLKNGETAGNVTVYKNGIAVLAYKDIKSGVDYTFKSTGEYKFVYDLGGGVSEEYIINVLPTDDGFIVHDVLESCAINTLIDCSDAVLLIDGKDISYDFSVEYPDGNKYSNKKFITDQVGVYKLTASAKIDDVVRTFEKEISVYSKSYDVFKTSSDAISFSHGKSVFTGREGAIITSSQANVLAEYVNPININKYVDQTKIVEGKSTYTAIADNAKPLIEFSVDPVSYGSVAATTTYIYLTDAEDPNNKLTIFVSNKSQSVWSYIRAAAPGQVSTGYMSSSSGTYNLDNLKGSLSTSYGFMVQHSYKGLVSAQAPQAKDSRIAIYYDNDTKQLLSIPAQNPNRSHIIMDLDNPSYLLDNPVWGGFKSDKVYLSIAIAGLENTTADLVVYSIDGVELNTEKMVYTEKPIITVDSPSKIYGLKGKSVRVPDAIAQDQFAGNIENLKTKVYYVNGNNLVDVAINNGRFNTKYSGEYKIVYDAADRYRNEAESVTVNVHVYDTYNSLSANFSVDKNEYSSGVVAVARSLISESDILVENAIGDVSIKRTVYFGTGGDKQEVECLTSNLYVEKVGDYLVEYLVSDSVGREVVISYVIKMVAPANPVIVSVVPVYVGFVRGNSYKISDIYYIDYNKENPTREKADIYINGEKYDKGVYSVERGANEAKDQTEETKENVVIDYKCGDYLLKSYTVPLKTVYKDDVVVLAGKEYPTTSFLIDRYFLETDKITATAGEKYTVVNSTDNHAELKFVQPISSTNLTFNFDADLEKTDKFTYQANNLKKITLRITDAYDDSKVLSVALSVNEEIEISSDGVENKTYNMVMRSNGSQSLPFSGSFYGTTSDTIQFRYNNRTQIFYDTLTSTELLYPETYDDGITVFDGFSDMVYISLILEGEDSTQPTSMRINEICGQTFVTGKSDDEVAPLITVNGGVSGVYRVGEKITVYSAEASDMLSDIKDSAFTVSVTLENAGEVAFVEDVNGELLENKSAKSEYEFILKKAGTYKIVYTVQDAKGNPVVRSFVITSMSSEKPTLTLSGEMPTSTTVGATVSLPNAVFGFEQESEANLSYAVLVSPSFKLSILKENIFVANEAGTYIVRYYACDSYGNYVLSEYDILCYDKAEGK